MQAHLQRAVPGVVTSINNGMTIPGVTVLVTWTMVRKVTDLAPGSGAYVLTLPLFKKAIVYMQKGRKFTVMANKPGIMRIFSGYCKTEQKLPAPFLTMIRSFRVDFCLEGGRNQVLVSL